MKILIAFFGMVRHTDTFESIVRNVYKPLEGYDVTRIASLNVPSVINSPRSGEVAIPYALPDLNMLQLDHLVTTQQDEKMEILATSLLRDIPQMHEADADFSMRRNAGLQMFSFLGLGSEDFHNYDIVIFLRPDLMYLTPIPIKLIKLKMLYRDVLVPSWHKWSGINDRIAVCNTSAAYAYTYRFDRIKYFKQLYPEFQSELFLKFCMRDYSIGSLPLKAARVRSDGSFNDNDRKLFKL